MDYNRVYNLISECIFNNGYGIEKKEIQISDVYFDTKDEVLKNKEIALRIRTINNKITKITLKIPGTALRIIRKGLNYKRIGQKNH